MTGHFFSPPPRPIGRGWKRRFRNAVLWLLLGGGAASIFFAMALSSWNNRSRSLRLAHWGDRSLCTVVSTRKTTGRSPRYFVKLRQDALPYSLPFEREVNRTDWVAALAGTKTVYYSDPTKPNLGIAEIERPYRERISPIIVGALFCAVTSLVVIFMLWKLAREMRLLRIGVERVEPQREFRFSLAFGERLVAIHRRAFLSGRWSILIRSPSGETARVVLSASDQSSFFYPVLSDVPVEKLIGQEMPSFTLGRPPRPANTNWSAWAAWRRRPAKVAIILLTGLAAAGVASSFVFGPSRVLWGLTAGILAGDAIFLLSWMHSYWRDRFLWQEGFEVQGVLLKEERRRAERGYRVGYAYHHHEFEHVAWLPAGQMPLLLESPPDAPAVTTRAILLIDPHRPHRWSLVPSEIARYPF